jgi:hypothetical protein
MGNGGIAPLFLDLGNRWEWPVSRSGSFTPEERNSRYPPYRRMEADFEMNLTPLLESGNYTSRFDILSTFSQENHILIFTISAY